MGYSHTNKGDSIKLSSRRHAPPIPADSHLGKPTNLSLSDLGKVIDLFKTNPDSTLAQKINNVLNKEDK